MNRLKRTPSLESFMESLLAGVLSVATAPAFDVKHTHILTVPNGRISIQDGFVYARPSGSM